MQKLNGISIYFEENISIDQWNNFRKKSNITSEEEINKNIKAFPPLKEVLKIC